MDNTTIRSIFYGLSISLGLFLGGCVKQKTDAEIQTITRNVLENKVLQVAADSGLVMMMEVNTGRIISNVKIINKDSLIIKESELGLKQKPESYGGLLQPLALMVVLESGNITMNDSVDTERGLFVYQENYVMDANYDHGGHGKIGVNTVIPLSSDIGVFKSLIKAFEAHQSDYFNFTGKIVDNLPFRDETLRGDSATQYLPELEYGVQLTPLQILTLYNTIANDGKMIYENNVLDPSIVSPTTIHNIQNTLQNVVSPSGTGRLAMSEMISIAGKTGTFIDISGLSGDTISRSASFCAYFPIEKPKYTCLVKIYNGNFGNYYGGTIAAPICKEIAEKLSSR